jgi:hypothetical protein
MCALCSQCAESMNHLLQCVYNREVLFKTLRRCSLHHLTPSTEDWFVEWWLRSRKLIPKLGHKTFDSGVILVVWCLWLQRNDRVSRNSVLTTAALADNIRLSS